MNEQRLWELICQNAKHIEVINKEMGGILQKVAGIEVHIGYLEGMLWWGLGILAAVFVGMLANIFMTKKNGIR